MHDVMRKRVWRKIEALPEQQLYQVLDFIEFLESKYAREEARQPTGFQRFAERFEDRMRHRRVATRAIGGAMAAVSAAGRVVDTVTGAGRGVFRAGRGLLDESADSLRRSGSEPARPARAPEDEAEDGAGTATVETPDESNRSP